MNVSSIFDIPIFVGNNNYFPGDIVSYNGYYYYATVASNDAVFTSSKWNGVIVHNSETKPYFFWTPSYADDTENEPNIRKTQFSEGYAQSSANGINNLLLTLNLSFNDRKIEEGTDILHFLKARGGTESFVFIPQPPYAKAKRFVCEKWTSSFTFKNTYSIRVVFQERPV